MQKLIRKYSYTHQAVTYSDIVHTIIELINSFYHSIAILRRPWRAQYDIKCNNKITALLMQYGTPFPETTDFPPYWIRP